MKDRVIALLRSSERYTKTDMVYLASSGFWLFFGQAGLVLISLVSAVAFGHLASQDTYGNYKYAITLAGLFSTFALTGVGTGIIQSVSRGKDGALRQGFKLNLKWSWGIVLISFAAAAYYFFLQHNVFLGIALILLGVSSPLINGYSLFSSLLIGQKQFKRDALYSIANTAFPTFAVVAGLFLTNRAIVLIVIYLVASLVADAYSYVLTLRQARNAATDEGLLSYSAHLSLMGILNTIADKIDSIAVFSFLGPAELAIYAYAIAMPEQIKQVIKMIAPLSMPKFANRSISEIQENIWRKMGYLAVGVVVSLLLYIFLAPFLFRYLFPIYVSAVGYSQLYALTLLLSFITTPLSAVFQAHKKVREQYITTNAPAILLLVLLPILTYAYGIFGAILSQLAYRFFSAVISVFYFVRLTDDGETTSA